MPCVQYPVCERSHAVVYEGRYRQRVRFSDGVILTVVLWGNDKE